MPLYDDSGIPTVLVAASDASASVQAMADYICDGTADHVEINSAINAVTTLGGKVVLSTGTFNISSNIAVLSYVTLEGQGYGTHIKLATNSTLSNAGLIFVKDASGNTRVTNVIIRGLRLNGNKANQSGGPTQYYGIYTEADNVIIENNWVHDNKGYGIDPHGTNGTQFKSTYYIIRDNFVYSNGTAASVDYDGITLDTITYGTISGNIVYSNARNGINMTTSGANVSVLGNTVVSNGLDGIVMQNSSTNAVISGNNVVNNTNNGIIISAVNHAAITGNMVNGNGQSGIILYRSSYNTISGNNLYNNSQTTNNGTSEIYLNDDGVTYNTYNSIVGNSITADASNKAKYGIEEKSASSDFNTYTGNTITGMVTASTNLKGVNRYEGFNKIAGDTFPEGVNISFGTATGTKIGTGTNQKIGFYNVAPVAQQGAATEIGSLLATLGLRASGSTYTISTSGLVSFSGGFKQPPIVRTGDATVSTSSTQYQLCNAASNNITITLPTAVGNSGQRYTIVKTDSSGNTVKYATVSSQTINGAAPGTLTAQWQKQAIVSDGSNWIDIT